MSMSKLSKRERNAPSYTSWGDKAEIRRKLLDLKAKLPSQLPEQKWTVNPQTLKVTAKSEG